MKQEAALRGQAGLQHYPLLSRRPANGCLQTCCLAESQAVPAGFHLQLSSMVSAELCLFFCLQGEPWPAAFVGHEVDPLTQQEEQRRLMLERFQQEVLSLIAQLEILHAWQSTHEEGPWSLQAWRSFHASLPERSQANVLAPSHCMSPADVVHGLRPRGAQSDPLLSHPSPCCSTQDLTSQELSFQGRRPTPAPSWVASLESEVSAQVGAAQQ